MRDEVEDRLQSAQRQDTRFRLSSWTAICVPDGQLNYPVSANPARPWVPEAFGEAHLVNGKLLPYLDVEPRKYRLRDSERRQWPLLSPVAGEWGRDSSDRHGPGIAAGSGHLKHLQLAPGERADIIVDFSAHRGEQIAADERAVRRSCSFAWAHRRSRMGSAMPRHCGPSERIAESAGRAHPDD